jgi:hypothetical protein
MLNVIMLNVIMLHVIMLNVVAPYFLQVTLITINKNGGKMLNQFLM